MGSIRQKILASDMTNFEKKVLLQVCKIPKGKTVTYGELARRIGKPGAARAVGQALKKNPFAPVVPCHRVVAKNWLGGYSGKGGIERKSRLLLSENSQFFNQKV